MINRNNLLIITFFGFLILLSGCSSSNNPTKIEESKTNINSNNSENLIEETIISNRNISEEEIILKNETGKVEEKLNILEEEKTFPSFPEDNWRNTELKDVVTGETYKISDFSGGKKVLVESFAVWCPTCTSQQKEVKKLHIAIGDKVESIAINTDPNEDEEKVLKHVEKNEFDWKYSIAESKFTQKLIEEFGISIVNAPGAPMFLVCENQSEVHLLKSGKKERNFLIEQINTLC